MDSIAGEGRKFFINIYVQTQVFWDKTFGVGFVLFMALKPETIQKLLSHMMDAKVGAYLWQKKKKRTLEPWDVSVLS